MGGKRRGKFERIYSESDSKSSEDETNTQITEISQNEKKIDEVENCKTSNNNNSTEIETNAGKSLVLPLVQNEKFLVTRPKRKYNKPELKLNLAKQSKDKNSEQNPIPPKRKRETIQSLNSKILDANNFFDRTQSDARSSGTRN